MGIPVVTLSLPVIKKLGPNMAQCTDMSHTFAIELLPVRMLRRGAIVWEIEREIEQENDSQIGGRHCRANAGLQAVRSDFVPTLGERASRLKTGDTSLLGTKPETIGHSQRPS